MNDYIGRLQLHNIFDESPVGVVITDPHGIIEYVNQTFCNTTGYPKNELIGKNPNLLKSGIHSSDNYKKMWDTLLSGQPWKDVFCNKKKNGELYWEQQYIYPLKNSHNIIEHFISLKIDITTQKQYEEQLVTTEHYLNSIIQALPVLLFIITPEGVIKKVMANDESLLYLSSQYILNRNLREIFPNDMADYFMRFITQTLQSGVSQTLEYSLETQKGLRWFEARSGIINNKNETLVLITATDITERIIIEKQKQNLLKTKDKLFSIIAHDLKNPLHAIMALSEMLATQNHTPENVEEMAKMLYEAGKNAYELLENLLEWSLAQTGKISFNPQKLNVFELVDETIEILFNQAHNKNITILNNIDKKAEWTLDKNIIKTVIRNVTGNAIKFTPEGGFIKIWSKISENKLIICIEDNGKGIKPEVIPILFTLSSISTSGTKNEKGSGLGLLLCKELITIHQGNIFVESTPGVGSKFYCELPAIQA